MESIIKEDDFAAEQLEKNILTFSPEEDYYKEKYGLTKHIVTIKYLLSVSSSFLIVEDGNFRFVFFPNQVKSNKIASLYERLSVVFGNLGLLTGVSANISLPWDVLDDEKFENLCYDIIYHHPKFDNGTIRKMGKSRSRDGGRDIVVYTNNIPGQPRKMYIFQCKFTKSGSSLTTRKVENISDTIVQYKAQGYGLMTPVLIDSALYDRVDSICQHFDIESDHWSVLEIERFIARHPRLKERHFRLN